MGTIEDSKQIRDALARLIHCAAGRLEPELVLKNARVCNLFTAELLNADVAIIDGLIAGIGHYEAAQVVDLQGAICCPSFIDGHIHIESSMLEPRQFAAAVIGHGTGTVVCDPHEIANVLGLDGIRFMMEQSENLPLDILTMAPSCVPATHMETSGATLHAADLSRLLPLPTVIGLAEMMNFPATIAADPAVLDKLLLARQQGLPIDGHAPGLTGKDLQAYCAAGIGSDHECTTAEEGREKLRLGMHLFIREGSTAKNLQALLPLVTPATADRCLFVSDDRHPDHLMTEGHLNTILRKAVAHGLDPFIALKMVTTNPARYFGLRDRGAIAPGLRADLAILDDLQEFRVQAVYKAGQEVSRWTPPLSTPDTENAVARNTVHLGPTKPSFHITAQAGQLRVIDCIDDQIVTRQALITPPIEDGQVLTDPAQDLAKLAVLERHQGSGRVGLGMIRGLGLKFGAIASTVAHDSHNLVVAGMSDAAMHLAVDTLNTLQGGLIVVDEHRVLACLALPIAGLMTDLPLNQVCRELGQLREALRQLGPSGGNPFMLLSFLALPVIPELKLTDLGLIDVQRFIPTPLWAVNETCPRTGCG